MILCPSFTTTQVASTTPVSPSPPTKPDPVSFSYGRALQEPPLKAWRGDAANLKKAQDAFGQRARLNGAARFGKYTHAMEKDLVGAGS